MPTALPSARSIIDRHQRDWRPRAIQRTRRSIGNHFHAGQRIGSALDVYCSKPDKSLVKINLGGIGDIVEGFDGTNGWSLQPMTGPMLKEGKELAEKKFDADFYSDLHEPGRYASMKTVEKTTFDGRPCYKISLARKDGGENEFYDVETGLKAGLWGHARHRWAHYRDADPHRLQETWRPARANDDETEPDGDRTGSAIRLIGMGQRAPLDVRPASADQGPHQVRRFRALVAVVAVALAGLAPAQTTQPGDTFDAAWRIIRDGISTRP